MSEEKKTSMTMKKTMRAMKTKQMMILTMRKTTRRRTIWTIWTMTSFFSAVVRRI